MSNPRREAGTAPAVRGWRVAFLVLATVGLCLAADLIRLHVKVHTDPDYHAYCAVSEGMNCETVAASPWAVFLGVPWAVWGAAAYLGMFVLAARGLRRRLPVPSWPFGLLFWANVVGTLLSLALFYVSHFVIESICVVCTGVYATNVLLTLVAGCEVRRSGATFAGALADELAAIRRTPARYATASAVFAAMLVAAWIPVPRYWSVEADRGPSELATGMTPDGHPWIGAERPAVEIVEFSDYQCPHCERGHRDLRQLVLDYPDTVRLVHRSYPLDQACNPAIAQPFHQFACAYARIAYCAGEQGKFWDANDYLFGQGRRGSPVTPEEVASALGLDSGRLGSCAGGPASAAHVGHDIAAGRAADVRGTPTFVLDGKSYPGRIPADVMRAALGRAGVGGAPAGESR
jgi:protein-disulfide isomerase/uncharacterized membrane protein